MLSRAPEQLANGRTTGSAGLWHRGIWHRGIWHRVIWHRVRTGVLGALVLAATIAVGGQVSGAGTASRGSGATGSGATVDRTDWLEVLNTYRGQAGLAIATENPAWTPGEEQHARYVVETDEVAHTQNPASPWYSTAGNAAAEAGNVAGWSASPVVAGDALDLWMAGPFHGVSLLDPDLRTSAFALHTDAGSTGVRSAAVLDVIRGLVDGSNKSYPRIWPGQGAVIPGTSLAAELPDPLTSCPGWSRPAGHPVYAFFGDPPSPTDVSVEHVGGSSPIDVCVITSSTYTNPDPSLQGLGRTVLGLRNAVVVIPRTPLVTGEQYQFDLTANGKSLSTTFSIGPLAWGPFFDVGPSHTFLDAIQWMVANNITSGYSDGTFRPAAPVSRQVLVTFLWRLAGSPSPTDPDPGFPDVSPTSPFREAIAWAVEEGITGGYSDGTFRPTLGVSRQVAMAFLWRYAGNPAPTNPDPGFPDVSPTSPFRSAISWGVEEGITGGYSDGTFRPTVVVSRQAAAAFIYGYSTP